MKVLVIGGSVFLGRNVVAEAQRAGAEVTVFNRGVSGPAPAGVEHVRGDRAVPADLEQLRGRRFDLVVDTCGYVPAEVTLSANLLADACAHYAFVSSINAFPGWPDDDDYHARGPWDGDPDATRADLPPGVDVRTSYGWLKVGCELAVRRAFGDARTAVLRAGVIVGPYDAAVGRLPWWLDRIARGGEVLVPGAPDEPVGLIDARDLAQFALAGAAGVFETAGPVGRDTLDDLVAACVRATGSDATCTRVDSDWLLKQDVQFWTELPLWIPTGVGPATFVSDASAAERAGLRWRPLHETVADTWAWQRHVEGGWRPAASTPGLAPDRERELLAGWHARS